MVIDALGTPQSLLLLGGTSDIAVAIATEYARRRPLRVVVAARPSSRRDDTAATLEAAGCTVEALDFEATRPETHRAVVEQAAADGDIDIAVVAHGILGDPEQAWTDPAAAIQLAEVNYVSPVACGVALATQVRRQGHGVIVALSSVAGERARRSNFAYGSTKAGMDAFYSGLGTALREHGGRVLVVRPGFVRSKMTEGLDTPPLSTTPEAVARAVVEGVASGAELIWVPKPMRWVMTVVRHLPRPVFRRLPF
ncbi:MAG TPA: decaprenylphospho-beta-D-erythro-pentofuranosid-2-ulose 2-reductase [Nocardioidaceae bacterium]|nr:decaprenylphospho-beta-D-erythro-pentofuranosid-2-ulose 2-reductase [Nocardioidaceae bacterium]